jgi:hypothetical protein
MRAFLVLLWLFLAFFDGALRPALAGAEGAVDSLGTVGNARGRCPDDGRAKVVASIVGRRQFGVPAEGLGPRQAAESFAAPVACVEAIIRAAAPMLAPEAQRRAADDEDRQEVVADLSTALGELGDEHERLKKLARRLSAEVRGWTGPWRARAAAAATWEEALSEVQPARELRPPSGRRAATKRPPNDRSGDENPARSGH